MKRPSSIRILCLLVLALLLAACERPAPREVEEEATVVPAGEVTVSAPLPTADVLLTAVPPTSESPGEGVVEGEATAVPATTESSTPTEQSHVVVAGETLSQLAVIYNVTVDELAAANGLSNADALEVGQVLTIPVPGSVVLTPTATAVASGEERVHIVQRGENLYRIGLQYGFTYQELADYNGIPNPNDIDVGQVIRIPPSN